MTAAIRHTPVRWAWVLPALLGVATAMAQAPITLQQAVDSAMKNNPRIKAAELGVISSRQAEGASFSLPNPELYTQNPGNGFYTIGVSQSIDFPGVYVRQSKQAKAATALAQTQLVVSELELKREVRRLYNEAQVQQAQLALLSDQDSLLNAVNEAARRQFDAGQIDKVQELFAATQYGLVHARYLAALARYDAALQQLLLVTGLRVRSEVETLDTRRDAPPDGSAPANSAALLAPALSAQQLSEAQWRTERSRTWPGLTGGYLNQGPADYPVNTRFQAGITLPIWFWQYNARIKSARSAMDQAGQEAEAVAVQLQRDALMSQAEVRAAWNALDYFNARGLADADALADAARRFFEQGRTDYVNYLRTLNDAYQLRLDHLDALRRYDQAAIELNYLNGTP